MEVWRVRRWLNWANGTTVFGLAVARLGRARLRPGPNGTTLAEGYRFRFPIAGAFTVGDVIVTSGHFDDLTRQNPDVLAHEQRHCAQYAALGALFLPLYVISMGWSWVFLRHLAIGNVFERHAGLRSGGYV